jgi:hypothetical protein
MLKARAGDLVILGLSDENLKRLKAGQPIKFAGADLRLDGVQTVLIFNAPTEADMERLMREQGYVIPG